jgi:hypothetical protein
LISAGIGMQPWLDIALDRFERQNEDLVPPTRSWLARIVPDPPMHARLQNTLSMLEHLGSRKIMATQHSAAIDQSTLRHVAEEAHHAFFMKRQAEKTAERPLEFVERDLLAPAAARMYFQRLEAVMVRVLEREPSVRAVYRYMSMIIEFRALWFYRLYDQALKQARHGLSLKRLLGEEQNHLAEIVKRLELGGELSDARAEQFLAAEKRLYSRLWKAMDGHS